MTDEEIEVVAAELAKVGGASWYPGRSKGALLRPVSNRYKDRARVAIAALDRLRASKSVVAPPSSDPDLSQQPSADPKADPVDGLQVGAVVVYRPPNDKRAISCRIEKLEGGRAYLVPCQLPDVGWIAVDSLIPAEANEQE